MGTTFLQKPPRLQKAKYQSESADTRPGSAANMGPRDQALNPGQAMCGMLWSLKYFLFSSSFFHQEIKNTTEAVYTKMSSLPEPGVEGLARGWRRGVTLLLLRTEFPERVCLPRRGEKPHARSTGRDTRARSPSARYREETEAQRGKATRPRSYIKLAPNQPRINGRDTVSVLFLCVLPRPA